MTKDKSSLIAVATARHTRDEKREQLKIEAAAWVETRMKEYNAQLEQAVMAALDDGHSLTSVAQAYTVSGKGPDRGSIYAIKAKYSNPQELWTGEYPFEWVGRSVETANGYRTIFDVVARLEDFGPDGVTGEFKWLYDRITYELDPVIGDGDPYPIGNKYYKQVLDRWLMTKPYPGEL